MTSFFFQEYELMRFAGVLAGVEFNTVGCCLAQTGRWCSAGTGINTK
jgi:hypothetical protein